MIEDLKRQITEAKEVGDVDKAKELQTRLIDIDKIPKTNKTPKVVTP